MNFAIEIRTSVDDQIYNCTLVVHVRNDLLEKVEEKELRIYLLGERMWKFWGNDSYLWKGYRWKTYTFSSFTKKEMSNKIRKYKREISTIIEKAEKLVNQQ